MRLVTAEGAADHAVGVAEVDHQRGVERRPAADLAARVVGRNPLALHQAVVGLPILLEMTVEEFAVVGVDDLIVDPLADAQSRRLDTPCDFRGPPDQQRLRDALVANDLHRAQHPLVLTLGKDDALGRQLGLREHRLHDHAGVVDEFVEALEVGRPVADRPRGDARIHARLGDCRRDLDDQARIEGLGDQVFGTEAGNFLAIGGGHDIRLLGPGQLGDGLDRGHLHFLGDRRRTDVERAAEDEGEAEDVVDLVRVVRAAGTDDGIVAHFPDALGQNLRRRVGERHDHRLCRHLGDHFGLQNPAGREAEEDVGALDHLAQRAGFGLLGIARLDLVHFLDAAFIDDALDVGDPDVGDRGAQHDQQVEAGQRGGAGAGSDDLHGRQILADQMQAVEDGRTDDDGRAVLVVVEDRNLHALAQLLFNVEAFGCLDVLEVDAAEGRLERGDGVDQLVRVAFVDLKVEHIDIGKFLEQDALALHHRLGGQRADRTEAEDGGAVGDDADQVAPRGQRARFARVRDDLLAGVSHTRRVGQRQVVLVGELLDRRDRDLSGLWLAMVVEGRLTQLLGIHVILRFTM